MKKTNIWFYKRPSTVFLHTEEMRSAGSLLEIACHFCELQQHFLLHSSGKSHVLSMVWKKFQEVQILMVHIFLTFGCLF